MAALVCGGITVPVAWTEGAPGNEVEEIGDRDRAFLGNELSSVRTTKRTQPIVTAPMLLAARDALRAVLTGTPPITCSGDILGASGSFGASVTSDRMVTVAGLGRRYVLSFELRDI